MSQSPRFPRLNAALHGIGRFAVQTGTAVAEHVDVDQLATIAVTAAMSGGNPAAIGASIGRAVLADLPSLLKNPAHQAAAADVVKAVQSVSAVVASAQAKAVPVS